MIFEKIKFRCLEIHVAHACNLKCKSCSHFSDQQHKGIITVDQLEEWCGDWPKRICPEEVNMLGGEPTLNKNLVEFVYSTRKNWTESKLNLITNGFFLHRHTDLPEVLQQTGTNLVVSIHHDSIDYQDKLKEIKSLVFGWQKKYNFKTEWRESYKNWKILFRSSGSDMLPFEDNNPKQSWRNCESKHTKQLYDGKIWKCPPLAYLKMQNDKYKMNGKLNEYLRYEPAAIEMKYSKLKEFLSLKHESYCSMCPANPESITKPNPL